jgi:hypothetical protein
MSFLRVLGAAKVDIEIQIGLCWAIGSCTCDDKDSGIVVGQSGVCGNHAGNHVGFLQDTTVWTMEWDQLVTHGFPTNDLLLTHPVNKTGMEESMIANFCFRFLCAV